MTSGCPRAAVGLGASLLLLSAPAVASLGDSRLELRQPELTLTWVATADERPRLLVLDLQATLGVDPELARLLGDMVVTRLHAIGNHQVLSTADVAAMVDAETQKQLVGCADDVCLTEIGGALDAGFLVVGSLSRLGERDLVTLKLLDTRQSRLTNQLTEELPADEGDYNEAMRQATYALLKLQAPPADETNWYQRWWVWAAVGAVVAGGTVTAVVLAQPASAPDAELGQVVLDAR